MTLANQQRSLLTDLRKLEVERDLKSEQLKQLEADAQKVARDLGNIGNQIDALEGEDRGSATDARSAHGRALQAGQRRLRPTALQRRDLKEFGRAYRMVAALAAIDRQRVSRAHSRT